MKFKLPIKIKSIASCLPEKIIDIANYPNFSTNDKQNLIKTTGVEFLRWSNSESSADLCLQAAKQILDTESPLHSEIDALIFVSQTPNAGMPGTSYYCHSKLGLHEDVLCFDFNYGCSGYIYGLLQAGLLLNSDNCRKILLLVGETNSKMTDPSNLQSRLFFGDAGTATIIEKSTSLVPFLLKNEAEANPSIFRQYGGYSKNTFHYNDFMIMNGLPIFKFAIKKVPQLIRDLLKYLEYNHDHISFYILHQANKFIIEYIAKTLGIAVNKFPISLKYTGNTGPASIPLLLSQKGEELALIKSLENMILAGFGVGLSWGGLCLNLEDTQFYKPVIYTSEDRIN